MEKLMEVLTKLDKINGLSNIEVYTGKIDGKYDRTYKIEEKEVLDTIVSDGKVDGFPDSYEVDKASYVCIVRFRNSDPERSSGEVEKITLFVSDERKEELMFNLFQEANKDNPDIYQKVFVDNYKGSIAKYKKEKDVKGTRIYPSEELIKENSGNKR